MLSWKLNEELKHQVGVVELIGGPNINRPICMSEKIAPLAVVVYAESYLEPRVVGTKIGLTKIY